MAIVFSALVVAAASQLVPATAGAVCPSGGVAIGSSLTVHGAQAVVTDASEIWPVGAIAHYVPGTGLVKEAPQPIAYFYRLANGTFAYVNALEKDSAARALKDDSPESIWQGGLGVITRGRDKEADVKPCFSEPWKPAS